jgi:UDP-galactopyranose mutase
MHRKWLIAGAGLTGAVLAERIARILGQSVLVIDRRSHIGGNVYDYLDESGVLVHRYGPHIFHTNAPAVAEYLSRFTHWHAYEHRVLGLVDGQFIPLPFNYTSMELVFGAREGARLNKLLTDEFGAEVKVPILKMKETRSCGIRRIADFIYEKVFLHYNLKQWGMPPEDLDPSVSARVPVHLSRDDRYFQDSFQKMPADGYTALVNRLLDHPLIEVRTGVSFRDVEASEKFGRIIFTGPIDEFFNYKHGGLPYRSLHFRMVSTPSEKPIQRVGQENYPTSAEEHPYTRTTEFRLLTGQDGIGCTTQAFEYPAPYVIGENEPYYPIPREDNREIYRKYKAEAAKLRTVLFAGRLADYNYYNMDQAVACALSCFEKHIVRAAEAA